MAERKYFPVGIETFSELIEKDYVYVDKTAYIHNLVTEGKYYFLSRPRRFGKSLLLSTIEAFFQGRRELFDGLAITSYDHNWDKHPVFRLNLVNFDTGSTAGLLSILEQHIAGWEHEYGIPAGKLELAQRFYGVIRKAVETSGKQAVVLIDEYDKALVSSLDDHALNEKFRAILKPIYGTLKAADRYIRFGMITGVSRFSRLSIFSDVNNLNDISLDESFNAICGITEEELLRDCRLGIEKLARRFSVSFEDMFGILKQNYDGYHFTAASPDIYNPFSLMSAFRKEETGAYWFATGTPTFLISALRDADTYLPDLLHTEADTTELANIDTDSGSAAALLFQTGYLTIKSYDPVFKTYRLGLPNREVSEGFFKDLLPAYMNNEQGAGLRNVRNLCLKLMKGDVDGFLNHLKSFLADIPYDLSKNKPEVYFENNIYIIFKLMGFIVHTEYRTSAGRIDLLVATEQYIYVIELKLNGTAGEALAQIDDRQYAQAFGSDGRKVFKIGIAFSPATRNIDNWVVG